MIRWDRMWQRKLSLPQLIPFIVFIYVIISFILHPFSPLYTHQLDDPDDYMRLNEVIAWLQGQNWFDLGVPRMSPGAHTIIHWSRLVDMPIALVMSPLRLFMPLREAAFTAALIVPFGMLALLLILVVAGAQSFAGKDRAFLAACVVLFMPMIMFNVSMGRVDHHIYQILIAGFGILSLDRILSQTNGACFALMSAACFSCGLWIGTEALPWLILFTTCLAIAAAWYGGTVARHAALFGVALFVGTGCVMFVALPVNQYASRALSWFSLTDVIFAGLTALLFGILWISENHTKRRSLRLGLVTGLGLMAAVLFLVLVPSALSGPFADYDHFNASTALDNINEAQPFIKKLHSDLTDTFTHLQILGKITQFLFLPFTAFLTIVFVLFQNTTVRRSLWLVHGFFLLAAILLTIFWQTRAGYFMELFSIGPVVWVVWRGWDLSEQRLGRIPSLVAQIIFFLLLIPLPTLLFPLSLNDGATAADAAFFPVGDRPKSVTLQPVIDYLDHTDQHGVLTIMAKTDEGPQLLFSTPHNVIGGNYNVSGNQDVVDFFKSHNDSQALYILHKWHVDLVLTDRTISGFYIDYDHAFTGLKNSEHPVTRTLLERLLKDQPPAWLKPIEISSDKDYLLYAVQPLDHPAP